MVAGMDALSDPAKNILTRRANQGHYSTIAQFLKSPMALPDGHFGSITGQKSEKLKLHRPGRR